MSTTTLDLAHGRDWSFEPAPISLTRAQIAALEAEARRVLREVEPDHARWERYESRRCLLEGAVLQDGDAGVYVAMSVSKWRPSRDASGALRGGWLDDAVPPLPTRGWANAGEMGVLIPDCGREGRASLAERYAGTCLRYATTPWGPRTLRDVIERQPCGVLEENARTENVSRASWWWKRFDVRRMSRQFAAGASRGWCPKLGADANEAAPGHPASWRAMQRAHDAVIRETDAQWALERAALGGG